MTGTPLTGVTGTGGLFSLPDGRYVVAGNRWDLLGDRQPSMPPTVSVIVTHFCDQRNLDRVLAALSWQRYPSDRVEIIVADDGSPQQPVVPAQVTLVRQENRGFRAAAARNLAARQATGEVLVFLDGDTIPEPDYLGRLVRLPALLADAVVTGRRRHADLTGWTPDMLRAWFSEDRAALPSDNLPALPGEDGAALPGEDRAALPGENRAGPPELTEPGWLIEEHRRSGNLLTVGPMSYRFVISAVMACARRLFEEIGGFDESMVGYGGEDWDLAHRALCAGAVLAHVPTAIAWHDGPEWAERGTAAGRLHAKDLETRALARRIPDLQAQTGPVNVLATMTVAQADEASRATVASLLKAPGGCAVQLTGEAAETIKNLFFPGDNRVTAGPADAAVAAPARMLAWLPGPSKDAEVKDAEVIVAAAARHLLQVGTGRVTTAGMVIEASAAHRRAARWQAQLPGRDLVAELFGELRVAADDVR